MIRIVTRQFRRE